MNTTLIEELEQAAAETVCFCGEVETPCAQCRFAVRLRQRAAWARELEAKANAYPLAMTYERRTIAALTGPIPSPGTATTERKET